MNIITLQNNKVPNCSKWHEIHWNLGIKEEMLSSYLEKMNLKPKIIYKLPSGSWAIPIDEE
jgi:hypothetical protein